MDILGVLVKVFKEKPTTHAPVILGEHLTFQILRQIC